MNGTPAPPARSSQTFGAGNRSNSNAGLSIPPEWLEQIAARTAELLADHETAATVDSGYLDVAGAAEFLACSASRIYGLVSARRIPFHKDGSRVLFDRGELRRYVEQGGAKCP